MFVESKLEWELEREDWVDCHVEALSKREGQQSKRHFLGKWIPYWYFKQLTVSDWGSPPVLSHWVLGIESPEVGEETASDKQESALREEDSRIAQTVVEETSPDWTNQLRELVPHHERNLVGRLASEVKRGHHEDATHHHALCKAFYEASEHRHSNEESIVGDVSSQSKSNHGERLEEEQWLSWIKLATPR